MSLNLALLMGELKTVTAVVHSPELTPGFQPFQLVTPEIKQCLPCNVPSVSCFICSPVLDVKLLSNSQEAKAMVKGKSKNHIIVIIILFGVAEMC